MEDDVLNLPDDKGTYVLVMHVPEGKTHHIEQCQQCDCELLPIMKVKIQFTEAGPHEWPVCPSCKKELREIKFRKRGWLTTLTVFWCPHCQSLLSTSTTFNG